MNIQSREGKKMFGWNKEKQSNNLFDSYEVVNASNATVTDRLKVPGGWVYRSRYFNIAVALTFVPEPKE
jgi:hypothetical protein